MFYNIFYPQSYHLVNVIQELIMDITLCCELLNDVLKHPNLDKHRSVYIDHINSDWIGTVYIVCIE